MRNPLAIDPVSKTAGFFDEELRSPLLDFYDGDGAKQIEALWQYAASAKKCRLRPERNRPNERGVTAAPALSAGRATGLRLEFAPKTKLIACADGLGAREVDLQQLLALHRSAVLVGQARHDLARADVDHIARGRVGISAVEAERDPAGLVPDLNAGELFGRQHRGIKDVHAAVVRVRQPELFLIRGQAHAMAGAAMPLGRPGFKSFHFDAVQDLAGGQITHLEAKQIIHVNKAERSLSIDGKRPDDIAEEPDLTAELVCGQVSDPQGG